MSLVYLDANVLVPSYTRTLLVMAAPLSDFTVIWSLHAEAEAERHQEPGAAPISVLRKRFGWKALAPDGDIELDDTDTKDKPILSAAFLAGADLVITENVKDFGVEDLARLRMSAVHPDLFLANRLSMGSYGKILATGWPRQGRESLTSTRRYIESRPVGVCLSWRNAWSTPTPSHPFRQPREHHG